MMVLQTSQRFHTTYRDFFQLEEKMKISFEKLMILIFFTFLFKTLIVFSIKTKKNRYIPL